ncbi:MAG: SDR family NAD(P)-dependent oxidoreductase [Thermoleophilia bacterium]|jgi:3-oxoacyl-[acyl-carrier protein] reductase
MDLGFEGKVALVTGAASQIGYGKEIALLLAREGCRVVVADIDPKGSAQTVEQIESMGREAIAVETDVTDPTAVDALVAAALERFGCIDILINNAGGVVGGKPFLEMTKDECAFNMEVNLYGQMNVCRAVIPGMVARRYGRVVSISGGQGLMYLSAYGASKAAIEAFTHSLAGEVAQFGVIVNGVHPGLSETKLTLTTPREVLEMNAQMSALKRLCTAQDVAPLVAFLASDLCSYMVGQFVHMDTFVGV